MEGDGPIILQFVSHNLHFKIKVLFFVLLVQPDRLKQMRMKPKHTCKCSNESCHVEYHCLYSASYIALAKSLAYQAVRRCVLGSPSHFSYPVLTAHCPKDMNNNILETCANNNQVE